MTRSSGCFTLVPVDDEVIENPSILTLSISSEDDVSLDLLGDATLTVNDNDCEFVPVCLAPKL
jgi:hypothetical protein